MPSHCDRLRRHYRVSSERAKRATQRATRNQATSNIKALNGGKWAAAHSAVYCSANTHTTQAYRPSQATPRAKGTYRGSTGTLALQTGAHSVSNVSITPNTSQHQLPFHDCCHCQHHQIHSTEIAQHLVPLTRRKRFFANTIVRQ